MKYNSNMRSSRYVSDSSHAKKLNEEQMINVVFKSTNGTRTENNPRIVTIYAGMAKKAIIALCCICVVVASGITSFSIDKINDFREDRLISQYSSQYRREAIGHNTHRTQNNQYYYYDHADVHDDGMDYLQRDGVLTASGSLSEDTAEDLSVYFAYRNFDEKQMEKFFDENGYSCDTLEEYVHREGFKSVEEWAEKQGDKVILLDKAKNDGLELQQMFQDTETIEDVAKTELNDSLGGK